MQVNYIIFVLLTLAIDILSGSTRFICSAIYIYFFPTHLHMLWALKSAFTCAQTFGPLMPYKVCCLMTACCHTTGPERNKHTLNEFSDAKS